MATEAEKRGKFKEKRSLSFGSLKAFGRENSDRDLITVKNPIWMTSNAPAAAHVAKEKKHKKEKPAKKEKEKKEKKVTKTAYDEAKPVTAAPPQPVSRDKIKKLDLKLSDVTDAPESQGSNHSSLPSERSNVSDRSDWTDDSKRVRDAKRGNSPRSSAPRRDALSRDSADAASKRIPSDRDRIQRDRAGSNSGGAIPLLVTQTSSNTTPRSTASPSPRPTTPTSVAYSSVMLSDTVATNNGSEIRRRNPLFQMPNAAAKLSPSAELRAIQNSALPEKIVRNPLWKPRAAMMQLLHMRRFAVLSALTEVVQPKQYEDFGKHVFFLFEPRTDLLRRLMRWALRREVSTVAPDQFFRVLDPPTKLLSLYLRRQGGSYLRAGLRAFLLALEDSSGQSWELDPAKLAPGESPSTNADRLCSVTRLLLDELHRMSDKVSPGVRRLFRYTRQQYPAFERTVFGGLFFLRFVCPAVAAPDSFNLLDQPPSREMRRRLILVSKLLQNLANDVLFGDKEPFMEPLNRFLTAQKHSVSSLLTRLIKPSHKARRKSMQPAPSLLLLDEADYQQEDPVEYIKQQMHLHRDRVAKRIPKRLPDCYVRFTQYCNTLRGMEPRRVLVDGPPPTDDSGSSISGISAGRERELSVGSNSAAPGESSGSALQRSASIDELGLLTREIKAKLKSWARGHEEALEVEMRALEQRLEQEVRVRHGLERQVQMLRSQLETEQKARRELVTRLQKYEPGPIISSMSGPLFAPSAPVNRSPSGPLTTLAPVVALTPERATLSGVTSANTTPDPSPPDRPTVMRHGFVGTPRGGVEPSSLAPESGARPKQPVRWISMSSLRKRSVAKTTSVSFDAPPQLPVPVIVRAADTTALAPRESADSRRMSFG